MGVRHPAEWRRAPFGQGQAGSLRRLAAGCLGEGGYPDCSCLLGGRIDVGRGPGDELLIAWDSQLAAAPVDIHSGSLASLWADAVFDHAALSCELSGWDALLSMPVENRYYIVTGDFGADSFGRPRPASTAGCP